MITNPFNLIKTISNESYHLSSAFGHSSLVKVLKSPAHYKFNVYKESNAMNFGTAFHSIILEPNEFYKTYVKHSSLDGSLSLLQEYKDIAGDLNIKVSGKTKDVLKTEIKNEINKNPNLLTKVVRFLDDEEEKIKSSGQIILSDENYNSLLKMEISLNQHKGINDLMSLHGISEGSLFFTDKDTGIDCKIRPDRLIFDEVNNKFIIFDLKKTRDASKDGFSKACGNYGYDIQAAFYSDALKTIFGDVDVEFYFVACEEIVPFACALYKASNNMLEQGRIKYRAALSAVKYCVDNDFWPSYQPFGNSEEIDIPRWSEVEEFE